MRRISFTLVIHAQLILSSLNIEERDYVVGVKSVFMTESCLSLLTDMLAGILLRLRLTKSFTCKERQQFSLPKSPIRVSTGVNFSPAKILERSKFINAMAEFNRANNSNGNSNGNNSNINTNNNNNQNPTSATSANPQNDILAQIAATINSGKDSKNGSGTNETSDVHSNNVHNEVSANVSNRKNSGSDKAQSDGDFQIYSPTKNKGKDKQKSILFIAG